MMISRPPTPLIGDTSCHKPRDGLHFHTVGDKYVEDVVLGSGGLPVLVPAIGDRLDPDALLDRLDGLLVTGSPSNVD
ncbi:gamma-glutamyl-gamma-aminobutyrate hydrolase family protein, partial [Klebsiella pneumoniae]|nr:gamma-glutamyl-gamma-aminobutyrate hydrolase family protein [Klebsiella pneumoniae]MCP6594622.1 gamma-glutamyl-gamma-aminobutyrate hydrolase family protein [Klebsiella pneumoniae]